MKTYRTRFSIFLVVLLFAVSLPIFYLVFTAIQQGSASEVYANLGILIFYYAIAVGALWTTYTIDPDNRQLIISNMFGLAKSRKDIMKMTRISKTRSIMSAPASSLKRIRIDYMESRFFNEIVISPYQQDDFIAELKKINNAIVNDVK